MELFKHFKKISKEAYQDFKSLQSYLQWLIIAAIGGVVFYAIIIFGIAIFSKAVSFEHIGSVGDSFGAATSFFSCLTVIGLLITISQQRDANKKQQEANDLQRKELQDTRDELAMTREAHEQQSETLKTQQFETTFFNILRTLRNNANELNIDGGKGDNGFFIVCQHINANETEFHRLHVKPTNDPIGSRYKFEPIYDKNKSQLNRYFGFIITCLNFVTEQCPENNKSLYLKLLASSLSQYEHKVIFAYVAHLKAVGEESYFLDTYNKSEFLPYQKEIGF